MKKLFWIIPLTAFLFACEKNDNDPIPDEFILVNGLYKGTFTRSGMDTVNVSINVEQGNFEGQSERQFYPAICHGSFSGDNGGIHFGDSCAWKANFDWSLTLNGRYEYSLEDNNVRIWRNNGTVIDEYLLKREVRQ